MGILTLDITCPHCLKEKATLTAFGEVRKNANNYCVSFLCRSCGNPVSANVRSRYPSNFFSFPNIIDSEHPAHPSHHEHNDHPAHPSTPSSPMEYTKKYSDDSLPSSKHFELVDYFPKEITHTAPENTPLRAADSFIEAKDNVNRGRFDTAVMLCRKTIDIATRSLLGDDSKDEKLVKRISMLRGKDLITEQMKDWAHIVRIDSNGAVHSDEEFTKEEAEEMIGFTEVFLMYSFTLPAMVTAKQQAAAS